MLLGIVMFGFAVFSVLRGTIINNLWWVFAVTAFATAFGLAVAAWADGIKGEKIAKSLIFMPMAISAVGASIIWRFMYSSRPAGKEQNGTLNAAWIWLGEPLTIIQIVAMLVVLGALAGIVTSQTGIGSKPRPLRR